MNTAEVISRRRDVTKFHAIMGNVIKSVKSAGGKIAGGFIYGEETYHILRNKFILNGLDMEVPNELADIIGAMIDDEEGRGSHEIYEMMVDAREIARDELDVLEKNKDNVKDGSARSKGKGKAKITPAMIYKSFLQLVMGDYIWVPIEYFATSNIYPDFDTMPQSVAEYIDKYINGIGSEVVNAFFETDEDYPDVPGIPYLDMEGTRGWKKKIVFEVILIWQSSSIHQKSNSASLNPTKFKKIINGILPEKFKTTEYERKALVVSPTEFKKDLKASIRDSLIADSIRFSLTKDFITNPLEHINTPKYTVYNRSLAPDFMKMLDIPRLDSFPVLKYDSPIARFLWLEKGSILYIVQEDYVLDLPTRIIVNYRRVA